MEEVYSKVKLQMILKLVLTLQSLWSLKIWLPHLSMVSKSQFGFILDYQIIGFQPLNRKIKEIFI